MSETGPAAGVVPGLEQLLLDPTKLTIVSLVSATIWCEFAFVRDHAGLSDSALSKQITTLGGANLIEIRKGHVGKRRCTWVRATADGRERLRAHVTALQQIADRAGQVAANRPDDAAGTGVDPGAVSDCGFPWPDDRWPWSGPPAGAPLRAPTACRWARTTVESAGTARARSPSAPAWTHPIRGWTGRSACVESSSARRTVF
jgi:DNA-binding transcriptional ArsR family regulator